VVLRRPVAQARQHHVADHRVVAVQGVAGAAVVRVVALRGEHVVGRVVHPPERDGGAVFVPLGRVVVDDVQHHLDAVAVEVLDERLELVRDRRAVSHRAGRGEPCLRGEEPQGAVAPVVQQGLAGLRVEPAVLELVEGVDRHQLDAVDPEVPQVGDLLPERREGAGVPDAGRRVAREAADVQLVDDQVFHRDLERPVSLPIEVLAGDARAVLVGEVPVGLTAPDVAAADGAGPRIEQDRAGIEPVPPGLAAAGPLVRPIQPEAVLDPLGVEVEHGHGEDVADAELPPHGFVPVDAPEHPAEGDLGHRLGRALLEEHEDAVVGMAGEDREVDPARDDRRPEGVRPAEPDEEPPATVGRIDVDARRSGDCCHCLPPSGRFRPPRPDRPRRCRPS